VTLKLTLTWYLETYSWYTGQVEALKKTEGRNLETDSRFSHLLGKKWNNQKTEESYKHSKSGLEKVFSLFSSSHFFKYFKIETIAETTFAF